MRATAQDCINCLVSLHPAPLDGWRRPGKSLSRLTRRAPQVESRFQVCKLLDRFVVAGIVVLIHEAEGKELIWTFVVLGIPHDGLLGHADHFTGWDIASVGELEVFQDLTLDGYWYTGQGAVG